MNSKNYEIDYAEAVLLLKLREAEESVKAEANWLTLDELKNMMNAKL